MAKEKKRNDLNQSAKAKKEAEIKPGRRESSEREEENSNPFDFGGLPARDLKKNLGGCG